MLSLSYRIFCKLSDITGIMLANFQFRLFFDLLGLITVTVVELQYHTVFVSGDYVGYMVA
jgi:hypothetical protein